MHKKLSRFGDKRTNYTSDKWKFKKMATLIEDFYLISPQSSALQYSTVVGIFLTSAQKTYLGYSALFFIYDFAHFKAL